MSRKQAKPALLRPVACIWMAAFCSLQVPANGDDLNPWRHVAGVDTVTVRIHWVSESTLKSEARKYGKIPSSRAEGFSVLRLDTRSEQYACDIYLIERPRRVGDKATDSLGHELAHCLGFSHERGMVSR